MNMIHKNASSRRLKSVISELEVNRL